MGGADFGFPLDPIERLEFGDLTMAAAGLDPCYVVRLEDGGAVSVVAAVTGGDAEDEAESVGPQPRFASAEESAGEVGGEPKTGAVIQSPTRKSVKRVAHSDDGPADSTQSTFHMNPEAPGWIKRVRVGGNAAERTPCASRVGALEQTIRSYTEKRGEHVVEPSLGLTFDSLGEAYDFYNLYSWEHGFGIRYGKSRLNPERTKTMQEIVCGCSIRFGYMASQVKRIQGHAATSVQQWYGCFEQKIMAGI
uniref:Uncharacterized protein n=1 Tax=Avena sativa TaxID=4498 RepID=A0ACD5Z607_AVESA